MRNHVINRLVEKAREDDRIVLLTGDLGFHVTEPFEQEFPQRFVNCGIAEENMMAAAAGMAVGGDTVFVYSIGNFPTLRCLEQIRNDVCYHDANVNILSAGGGFSYGSLGMTHHATEDLSVMRALPGIRVYAPADPQEAVLCLDDMLKTAQPCYMRLARGQDEMLHPAGIGSGITGIVPYEKYEGGSFDAVILTAGTVLQEGIICAQMLGGQHRKAGVYSCPLIKPFSEQQVRELALSSKLMVTLEENNIMGGLGGAVAEILSGMPAHAVLLRIGLPDVYAGQAGSGAYLRKYYGMDAGTVFQKIMEMLEHL